ncbi:hypothetical protein DER29_2687 [Micromonospora sp. M71_S20]|nr:hypothetical protein [Micromonospora sp. M71_S20]RLK24753.1 hypothetical protein DER29_2687 [Micromonospora sp. M71_S20]
MTPSITSGNRPDGTRKIINLGYMILKNIDCGSRYVSSCHPMIALRCPF